MAQASVWLSVQIILVSFIYFGTGDGQSGSYHVCSNYPMAYHELKLSSVYLSLGQTNFTTNNTEVLITDIGEDASDGLPSLTCHTDLTECYRKIDTGDQGGRGEWYYPDGRVVQNNTASTAAGENLYRVRNAPRVVRLARRDSGNPLSPTGSFCCVIPTTKGEMTFCANIGMHIE